MDAQERQTFREEIIQQILAELRLDVRVEDRGSYSSVRVLRVGLFYGTEEVTHDSVDIGDLQGG